MRLPNPSTATCNLPSVCRAIVLLLKSFQIAQVCCVSSRISLIDHTKGNPSRHPPHGLQKAPVLRNRYSTIALPFRNFNSYTTPLAVWPEEARPIPGAGRKKGGAPTQPCRDLEEECPCENAKYDKNAQRENDESYSLKIPREDQDVDGVSLSGAWL